MSANKLAVDPFVGTAVKEREAAVPVVQVENAAARVQTIPADLGELELRKRHMTLQGRRGGLTAQLTDSEAKEAALASALEGLKSNLAEGGSAEEIPGLLAKLEGRKAATAALRDALGRVEGEIGHVVGVIRNLEHEGERARQERASTRLKAKRAQAAATFVAALAELLEPLKREEELRREIAEKYPLAAQPVPPSLSSLARETKQAWVDSGRYIEQAHPNFQDAAFERYLTAVVRGPFIGIGTEEDGILRRLGGK